MVFSNPFNVSAFALIILYMTYSIEEIDGFIAPLIHRTSPKHPLYHPDATPEDILRENKHISMVRQRHFARQRLGYGSFNGVAPINFDVIMRYSIGTPAVESLGVPDTGSHLLWQQCQPCVECFREVKPIFDPLNSSTYQSVNCGSQVCTKDNGFHCGEKESSCLYQILYVDGSVSSGTIGTDSFTFAGNQYYPKVTLPNTIFGCGDYNEMKFGTGFSGILGLQNTSISLANQFGIDSFSYCTSGRDGGFLHLGTRNTFAGFKTTLFTDPYNAYQVNLLGITVATPEDSSNLNMSSDIFKMMKDKPHTGTTIDTGSAFTFLHPDAFGALVSKIGDFMGRYEPYTTSLYHICYKGDENEDRVSVDTMPSIGFVFNKNNIILWFPNRNIWSNDGDGNICLNIFPSETTLTTIGAEQLKDFNVGFDLRENLIWFNYQPSCV